jgi:C_GCAxxG_C_C family probable redox protein
MQLQEIERRAEECFASGFNCAEAVFLAITEACGLDMHGQVCLATPFGGGIGRCKAEVCGAISGAVLAIGAVRGRVNAHGNWDVAAQVAQAVREDARAIGGSTRCAALLQAFGQQSAMEACIRFTGKVAGCGAARLLEVEDLGVQAQPAVVRQQVAPDCSCGCAAADAERRNRACS